MPNTPDRNAILALLAVEDRERLRPDLERIDLPVRRRLADSNVPIDMVYFLESGIASVTTNIRHEVPLEIGITGREGVVNLAVLLGSDQSPSDIFMQIEGEGLRIPVDRLRDAMTQSRPLTLLLLRYAYVFMIQTGSTVLANGRASLAERLARWLLMARDRVEGDEIALTHEFLATMLGVRRPGVTVAVREFERRGLIDGGRGVITILDRKGLESAANGYYGVAEREYRRLFEE